MVHLQRTWLSVATTFVLIGVSVVASHREAQSQLVVERADGVYVLRYQDPDFDDRWMELRVPDATRARATLVSAVKPYGTGRWEYEYRLTNGADSAQSVLSWAMRVAHGTEVLVAPTGWQARMSDDPLLSTLTWFATDGVGLSPGRTISMSVVSDSLPDIYESTVRGTVQADYNAVDLPHLVRDRVLAIEAKNGIATYVVGPRIPTMLAGGELTSPAAILQAASATYRYAFLSKRHESSAAASGLHALDRFDAARRALERNDVMSAVGYLREASTVLRSSGSRNDTVASFASALGTVAEYAIARLGS